MLQTGKGAKRRCINVSGLRESITPVTCSALLGLYGFTGCNSTSVFQEKGKVKPIKLLLKKEKFIEAFSMLGNPWIVPEWTAVPRFAVQVWRWERFQKSSYFDLSSLPQCLSVLIQHLRHVNYQVAIWKRAHVAEPYLLRLKRWFCEAYHRGRSLEWSCSCCTLLFSFCSLRAIVSALICMQMIPMGCDVRLQRCSFRTSSLPASMMWPGWCDPTGSSWILQRPMFSGLHPVDASISTHVTHPSGHRLCHASFRCPHWTRRLHGRWCVNEVARFEDSIAACFAMLRQLRSIRRSVPRFVSRSAAVGLW